MNRTIRTVGMWSAIVAVGWMMTACGVERGNVASLEAADERNGPALEWKTDFDQAVQAAERLERPVLVNFTGSDWCGWCIRLHDEVFAHKPFQNYARHNLVLLEVDFPQGKELSEEQSRANQALAETYAVRGFPTILLLDAEGAVLARTGYQPGGSEAYVEHLRALLEAD